MEKLKVCKIYTNGTSGTVQELKELFKKALSPMKLQFINGIQYADICLWSVNANLLKLQESAGLGNSKTMGVVSEAYMFSEIYPEKYRILFNDYVDSDPKTKCCSEEVVFNESGIVGTLKKSGILISNHEVSLTELLQKWHHDHADEYERDPVPANFEKTVEDWAIEKFVHELVDASDSIDFSVKLYEMYEKYKENKRVK